MSASLAAAITRAASRQTYYTILFLVDPDRREDAYRAYAYFRWVDDILDADTPSDSVSRAGYFERSSFLDRQKFVLTQSLAGLAPRDANRHEAMLVDLIRHSGPGATGLELYLRNMMLVMQFDLRRRGRLVAQAELDAYTRWLATAVSEAMHHFMGNGADPPRDETRYLAVSGAHILHMLRDTYADTSAGYFNVPREVLESASIGPDDVHSDAYRAWVESRVTLARACFDGGREYFGRVQSQRHRFAGLAYMARFDWLIGTLERENFCVRPQYNERRNLATGLRMSWYAISRMAGVPRMGAAPRRFGSLRDERT